MSLGFTLALNHYFFHIPKLRNCNIEIFLFVELILRKHLIYQLK
jgi:hypothetical protein